MYICIYYSDKCHRFKNTHNCNEYPGRGNNLRVYNSILKRIDISLTVFMDKPEAFDTLDHPVLHNKLNHHGIEGTALACPPNYFTWRHHCIELDWASSSVLFLSTRFLQGYVLRPLFFSCDQAALRTLLSVRPSVRPSVCLSVCLSVTPFYPAALRAGGVLSSRFGRAGGCQTCGTHISVTAWRIFSIRSSEELSRPVVVHCHGHLPICPIWACPWAKNLSNFPQIGSRLCISLKLLDGFAPFKVLWTCLDL